MRSLIGAQLLTVLNHWLQPIVESNPMSRKNRTHGCAMRKFTNSCLLIIAVASMSLMMSGCTAGSGGVASAPAFPPASLDYSSQLEKLQARKDGSPYVPQGGFDSAPNRGSLFSSGSGSRSLARSGSC